MKNYKIKIFAIVVVTLILITSLFLVKASNKEEASFDGDTSMIKQIVNKNTLSMMLETEAGSGKYEMTTVSSWPTDGYFFNSTLSKCESGGEVSWDNEKKLVLFAGNNVDKCYIYFDIYNPFLTDYVKSFYTGTQGDNNIYYHDSSLTNGAGDNSYRYAGASDVVNNFVCFGSTLDICPTDSLYRIIGVFGDQVKLIKYDYATSALLGTDVDYSAQYTYGSDYYK